MPEFFAFGPSRAPHPCAPLRATDRTADDQEADIIPMNDGQLFAKVLPQQTHQEINLRFRAAQFSIENAYKVSAGILSAHSSQSQFERIERRRGAPRFGASDGRCAQRPLPSMITANVLGKLVGIKLRE